MAEILRLDDIAACLESLEDTIVYKLLDRAQFKQNSVIYTDGLSNYVESNMMSLFDIRLRLQEEIDSKFGRFLDPSEKPFTKKLPLPKREFTYPGAYSFPKIKSRINLTHKIKQSYLRSVKILCGSGDDGHYGSSVELDVYALQAISRRVHLGAIYIAESKYQERPQFYYPLIMSRNVEMILKALTRKEKEDEIINRMVNKLASVQALINKQTRHTVEKDVIVHIFRDMIIPITKEGEVRYLLNKSKSLYFN